jgi:hypothetical protein
LQQVNEIQPGKAGQDPAQAAAGNGKGTDAASSSSQDAADDASLSSSKHKKKKGLKKVIPF